ncbi:MAG: hypothetical protein RL233_393 [Bacteroidota bacterium]
MKIDIGRNQILRSLALGGLTFSIYTCMYALRKPFSGLTYNDLTLWGFNVKIWMVLCQLIGYTLSKFVGIRFLGGLNRDYRGIFLICLMATSLVPLVILRFSVIEFWPFLMILNGFPLGLVWGLVFSYVEGRKHTELIGAMLACTFVFSSGWVKTIALWLQASLQLSINEVPYITGAFALFPAVVFIILLERFPGPSREDIELRIERKALDPKTQKKILGELQYLILPFVIIYGLLTILRDFRDNFSADMLNQYLVFNSQAFVKIELPVTLLLLCIVPGFSLIKSHIKSLKLTAYCISIGGCISLISVVGFQLQYLSLQALLIMSGAGLYLGYILINISVMDRIIGLSGISGNSSFLIYIADSIGYLFSLTITSIALLGNNDTVDWASIFNKLIIVGSVLILLLSQIVIYQLNKSLRKNENIITT